MITIQLTVTAAPGAPRVPLEIDPAITPTQLRQEAAKATKIPIASIKLIVRGRLVADNETLSAVKEYKLEEGTVLHCMGRPEDTGSVATDPVVASTTTASFTLPTVSVQVPTASATATGSTIPPSVTAAESDPLHSALTVLQTSNSPAVYQAAVSTLEKILSNIIEHPLEEKYRALKVQNPAFQRRLGGLPGGNAAILACGFTIENVEGEEKYYMEASAEKWPALLATKSKVTQAVMRANANNVPPPINNSLAAAGLGSLPPLGGMMGDMPVDAQQMRQAAAQLSSNPQLLQSMLQVRVYVVQQCFNFFRVSPSPLFNSWCKLVPSEPHGAKYAPE
jgi:PUB domain/Ubiquitin family